MRKFESGSRWCSEVSVETADCQKEGRAVIFQQDKDLICLNFEAIDDLIEFLRSEQERLK